MCFQPAFAVKNGATLVMTLKNVKRKMLGRYELQPNFRSGAGEYIEGGHARLYLARVTNRKGAPAGMPEYVCVKIWQPTELARRNNQVWLAERERFLNEGDMLSRLHSVHIVKFFESGSAKLEGALVYFHVLELCLSDLNTLIKRRHANAWTPQPNHVLRILRQLATATDYLHNHGIIHRDITPENCLIRANGTVCLADLGVALEQDGDSTLRVGTASYAAPEHNPTISGSGNTYPQSDVYSLAKLTLMMFRGDAPRDIAARPVTELPFKVRSNPWSDEVCHVLATATQANPAARQASALVFLDELRRAFAAYEVPRTLVMQPEPVLARLAFRPVAIVATLTVFFALSVMLAFIGLPSRLVAEPDHRCRVSVSRAQLRARRGAKLRSGPSLDSEIVCSLPAATTLTFLGNASADWLEVQSFDPTLETSCQQKGYVYAENIEWNCP